MLSNNQKNPHFFVSTMCTNILLVITLILHATVVAGLIAGIFEVKNKFGNVHTITAENIDSLVSDAVVASHNGRFASERMLPLMQEVSDMVHTAHEFVVPTSVDPKVQDGVGTGDGEKSRLVHRQRNVERPSHGAFGGLMDIDLSGIVAKVNEFDTTTVEDALKAFKEIPWTTELIPLAKRALDNVEGMEHIIVGITTALQSGPSLDAQ